MWRLKDQIEPAFNAPLLDNKFVGGGIFVVRTQTQRNNIGAAFRVLSGSQTTLVLVSDTNRLYKLVNNPGTETTIDSDWEALSLGTTGGLVPIGEWDVVTNIPALLDTSAEDRNGEFYFATNAGSGYTHTYTGLFGGTSVTVYNGDWIISVGDRWVILRPNVTWDMITKPQSIVDYVNGIVIDHEHVIGDVAELQTALDTKYDSDDTADHTIDFNTVPDQAIVEVEFLKQHYYTKAETYTRAEIDAMTNASSYWKTGGSTTLTDDVEIDADGNEITFVNALSVNYGVTGYSINSAAGGYTNVSSGLIINSSSAGIVNAVGAHQINVGVGGVSLHGAAQNNGLTRMLAMTEAGYIQWVNRADLGTGGGTVAAFTDLVDVPSAYAGQGLKGVRVKATEDGLEFFASGGSSMSSLTAATAPNTIDNLAHLQTWKWDSLAGGTGLVLSTISTAATGNTQTLFEVNMSGTPVAADQTTYAASFINTRPLTTNGINVALMLRATSGNTGQGKTIALYNKGQAVFAPHTNTIDLTQMDGSAIHIDQSTGGGPFKVRDSINGQNTLTTTRGGQWLFTTTERNAYNFTQTMTAVDNSNFQGNHLFAGTLTGSGNAARTLYSLLASQNFVSGAAGQTNVGIRVAGTMTASHTGAIFVGYDYGRTIAGAQAASAIQIAYRATTGNSVFGHTTPSARVHIRGANNLMGLRVEDDAGNPILEAGEDTDLPYFNFHNGTDVEGEMWTRAADGKLLSIAPGSAGAFLQMPVDSTQNPTWANPESITFPDTFKIHGLLPDTYAGGFAYSEIGNYDSTTDKFVGIRFYQWRGTAFTEMSLFAGCNTGVDGDSAVMNFRVGNNTLPGSYFGLASNVSLFSSADDPVSVPASYAGGPAIYTGVNTFIIDGILAAHTHLIKDVTEDAPDVQGMMGGAWMKSSASPSTDPASGVFIYSEIISGAHVPHFRLSNGNLIKLYQQAGGGAATAGGTYTATEQAMLQDAYDALRGMGILA